MFHLRVLLRTLPLLIAVGMLSACVLGSGGQVARPSVTASYQPLPDEQLYAAIGALPGVHKVQLTFSDTFENGRAYRGSVFVTDPAMQPAAAQALLDRVNAILWQGKPETTLAVEIRAEASPATKLLATPDDLGLRPSTGSWNQAERDRYGPRPGTGTPPAQPSSAPSAS